MNDGKTSLKIIFAVFHARLYIFMCAYTILDKLTIVIFILFKIEIMIPPQFWIDN